MESFPDEKPILVIDEGTTSTRAMLFARDGRCLFTAQEEITQHYPAPGRVEHDAEEILAKVIATSRRAIEHAGGADRIAAIAIANQRETLVAWDRKTEKPLHNAIVWQDKRTADLCSQMKSKGHEAPVQATTGLLLDPYFSGSKMRWMRENVDAVRDAGDRLAFGTVESWLVFKLTGGLHISDATNASRTQLMALSNSSWDAGLCDLFDTPLASLPEIVDCSGQLGTTQADIFGAPIPIAALVGDQQAATVGQACLKPGDVKATYGTGAFMLSNMGAKQPRSGHRLLGTVLTQLDGQRTYALEGSVFVAGSLIQWLRDSLGIIAQAGESEPLAREVDDNGGVYCIPALSGLGAPHWRPDARGAITGLSFSTGKAHIARAALEAMAHQTHDLAEAFAADGAAWQRLRIDGGMSANDWMAQDMADILDIEVERPDFVETTALGGAMLAAVGIGLYPDLDAAATMRGDVKQFSPDMRGEARQGRILGWRRALADALQERS